ncbi:MAG: amidohydrolase family protein [Gemmatimonadales bacterium]
MVHDLPAIDADGHTLERQSDIRPYLPSPWDERETSLWPEGDQPWDPMLFRKFPSQAVHAAMSPAEEVAAWLRLMDEHGMEYAVLFPTGAGSIAKLRETNFALVAARAANTMFARDYGSISPRVRPVGVLPLQDPVKAAEEMRYAVNELGLISFELLSLGQPFGLGDPFYDPIWAEAQRLSVPLCIHGNRSSAYEIGALRLGTFSEVHAWAFPAGLMLHFTSILCQGVPVRFPGVRIAFLEIGATWLPYYLDRLDEHWEKRGEFEMPHLPRPPSEIFRASPLYVSLEAGEGTLAGTIEYVGDDHFLYASDVPHWDNEFPHSLEAVRQHPDLSRETKERILYRNAQALFGLGTPAQTAALT